MTFDKNDPRLTAFVLAELDDREEAEIESLCEENPGRAEIRRDFGQNLVTWSRKRVYCIRQQPTNPTPLRRRCFLKAFCGRA